MGTVIAQWIGLHRPSCHLGFKSQAHHQCFFLGRFLPAFSLGSSYFYLLELSFENEDVRLGALACTLTYIPFVQTFQQQKDL